MGEQQIFQLVGTLSLVSRRFLLVRQRHGLQHVVIESHVGEVGNVGVHASLSVQQEAVCRVVLAQKAQHALEERQAAVGQPNGVKLCLLHLRHLLLLLHNGRKLLLIADEHKLADGWHPVVTGCEERHDVRFKNLRSLIHDGKVKMFYGEQFGM